MRTTRLKVTGKENTNWRSIGRDASNPATIISRRHGFCDREVASNFADHVKGCGRDKLRIDEALWAMPKNGIGVNTQKKKIFRLAIAAAVSVGSWSRMVAAQVITPAPFTQAQSDAGRQSYMTDCASCHGEDLAGKGAPALAGKSFSDSTFGQRTTAQLYTFTQNSMPFCEGGTLASQTYVNILAFLFQANGAKPGGEPLTPTTSVKLGDIITGDIPPGFLGNTKAK